MNTNVTIHRAAEIEPAASSSALAAALKAHANETIGVDLPGPKLKFVKGHWSIGDQEVSATEEFVVYPETIVKVWERWENKRIADRIIARLGEKLPSRSSLGDTDRSAWALGQNGKPSDPWTESHIVAMRRSRDNSPIVFVTASDGGKKSLGHLADAAAGRADFCPVVELSSSSYSHPTWGLIFTPQFDVTGWAPRNPKPLDAPAIAAPKAAAVQESKAPPARGSLNDDIDSLFGPSPPLSAYADDL
jgi:hypothetical protein